MSKNMSWALTGFVFGFVSLVAKEGFSAPALLAALAIGLFCAAMLALLSAFGLTESREERQARKRQP